VYPFVARLDNVNFAPKTIWEGRIESGETFLYDPRRPTGRQFIAEAAGLGTIEDASYDLVLSSHTLEHSANPLRVLGEWRRVLADDGVLVLVLPHKEGTFDHRRPTTTLEHLLEDERLGTEETDLSHLEEILALHDHDLHPVEEFEARSRRNAENRALHHHVFDTHLAVAMLDRARFELLAVEAGEPCDIVLVARKADGDNSLLLAADATWRRTSPFGLDSAAEQPL
jgi:SAM-dependent methyltransferase